jgi:trehalose/maltose hydrolase-like predicted phosphorylase
MFQDAFPADLRKAGYLYYDPRCSHTSSLSRCIFAAVAAQTGMVEEAYRQFMLSAEADIAEGAEMESESGIHTACMGGTWLAAVTGFGGVWPRGDIFTLNPRLPAHWTGMAFTLAWQGNVLDVELKQGASRIRTHGGTIEVQVGGRVETVGPEWSCWIPMEDKT